MIGNPSSHLMANEIMANRGEDSMRQGTDKRISVERFTKRSILLFLFSNSVLFCMVITLLFLYIEFAIDTDV